MSVQPAFELAISMPFTIDDFGTVGATIDQSKIWADRLRAVVGTALGERVYRPEFGCAAATSVYEDEEIVLATIQTDIRDSIKNFLPLIDTEKIDVTIDEYTRQITVEVVYSTPDATGYRIKVGVATIDGVNPISEEITWLTQ